MLKNIYFILNFNSTVAITFLYYFKYATTLFLASVSIVLRNLLSKKKKKKSVVHLFVFGEIIYFFHSLALLEIFSLSLVFSCDVLKCNFLILIA